MDSLEKIKVIFANLLAHRPGQCPICGRNTVFLCTDKATARNNMACLFCRSISRKRHVAKILLGHTPGKSRRLSDILRFGEKLQILNTDADDALYPLLSGLRGYQCSEFRPGVPLGGHIRENVTCQDLEQLEYADSSFDFVISEDVFEHIRNDKRGFREVHRVLKPGGRHIFTVPYLFDRPTIRRVDIQDGEDVYLLAPEYHEDKIRGTILAYRTYGFDLFDLLESIGFRTRLHLSTYADQRLGIFDSHVFVSTKPR